MALHSLYCADVPLRNCSLTTFSRRQFVSIFIQFFSGGRRNFPQDFCISKRRAFQPFKVIKSR